MANVLLPPAGRRLGIEKWEFSFYTVRKVPDVEGCGGYSCENIPEHLYDFKCTDYNEQDRLCQQRNGQKQQHHQQQQQNIMSSGGYKNLLPQSGFYANGTSNPSSDGQKNVRYLTDHRYGNPSGGQFEGAPIFERSTEGIRDMKRPTVPMPNCRHVQCCGKRRLLGLPGDGLWGYSASEVSNCGWNKEQHVHKRLADPQVVRPRDPNADSSTRPTGQPYFAQERRKCACVPAKAPKAIPTGFNFEQWLTTRQDREPPTGINEQCIASLCHLCGPSTVECCPGHAAPGQYLLAKTI